MNVSATIKNEFQKQTITVSTNGEFKSISIPAKPSTYGSSVNGAELLLLALATCFCNDIYREAAKRNIEISEINVECTGEFGREGEPGRNFQYKPTIRSQAPAQLINQLITDTDRVAEIQKTLRQGLEILLIT